jgi:hypothetical protein
VKVCGPPELGTSTVAAPAALRADGDGSGESGVSLSSASSGGVEPPSGKAAAPDEEERSVEDDSADESALDDEGPGEPASAGAP